MHGDDRHTPLFSEREGIRSTPKEISVRHDAPRALREALPQLMYSLDWTPSRLRLVVCKVLLVAPDRGNWRDHPNVAGEVDDLLEECDWEDVYDIVETLARVLDHWSGERDRYESKLNRLFWKQGIGWKLDGTSLVYRGDESFQDALETAERALTTVGHRDAASRLREALKDLSRRPEADATGAVTHAIAALEATARELDGRREMTLGKLIQALPVPADLREVLRAMWNFSSEYARHGREGRVVNVEEAELVVTIAAGMCTFLCRREAK